MGTISKLLDGIPLPSMLKVRQTFPRPVIDDVARELNIKLKIHPGLAQKKEGQSIAIGVGSRGISNLP